MASNARLVWEQLVLENKLGARARARRRRRRPVVRSAPARRRRRPRPPRRRPRPPRRRPGPSQRRPRATVAPRRRARPAARRRARAVAPRRRPSRRRPRASRRRSGPARRRPSQRRPRPRPRRRAAPRRAVVAVAAPRRRPRPRPRAARVAAEGVAAPRRVVARRRLPRGRAGARHDWRGRAFVFLVLLFRVLLLLLFLGRLLFLLFLFLLFLALLGCFFSAKAKSRASRSLPVSFTPQASTRTRCAAAGASFKYVSTFSIARTTSMPLFTSPKTTCLLSRCGAGPQVMKNWLPFVFGPAFAMLRSPALVCLKWKASSSNLPPYIDSPPVPLCSLKSPARGPSCDHEGDVDVVSVCPMAWRPPPTPSPRHPSRCPRVS